MKRDWSPQGIADKYIARDGGAPRRPAKKRKALVLDDDFIETMTALSLRRGLSHFQRDILRQALTIARAVRASL